MHINTNIRPMNGQLFTVESPVAKRWPDDCTTRIFSSFEIQYARGTDLIPPTCHVVLKHAIASFVTSTNSLLLLSSFLFLSRGKVCVMKHRFATANSYITDKLLLYFLGVAILRIFLLNYFISSAVVCSVCCFSAMLSTIIT